MVTLRFTNFKKDGSKKTTIWEFEPIKPRRAFFHIREEDNDASGRLLRNPVYEQDVKRFTIPVGVLLIEEHQTKFRNFLRAHEARIEVKEIVNGKEKWRAFIADFKDLTEPEYFEDLDKFETIEIVLFEEVPRDFTTWLGE